MRSNYSIVFPAVLAVLGVLIPRAAMAQSPAFDNESSAGLVQTSDLSSMSPQTNTVYVYAAGSPMIPSASPSLFQLSNTLTQGTSTTTASAAVYEISSATDMTLGIKSGTGVNQTNAEDPFTGDSALTMNIAYIWDLGSAFPAAGHSDSLLYQYNVGGNVDTGGSDTFIVNLTYTLISGGGSSISNVGSVSIDHTFSTPGAFSQLFSASTLINGGHALAPGSFLELTGTVEFEALDPFTGSSINLLSDSTTVVDGNMPLLSGAAPLPNSGAMGLVGLLLAAAFGWQARRRGFSA